MEQRGNVRGNPERAGRYVPPTTTAGGPGMLELCFSAGWMSCEESVRREESRLKEVGKRWNK